MRLIYAHTLKLKEFNDEKTRPPYGILSHTWGVDEITLQDLKWLQDLDEWEDEPTPRERQKRDRLKTSAGYQKVANAALQALQDGLEYVWADTCCIDKTSSVELSEAINSMYKWYEDSRVCYAYLSDVVPDEDFPGYDAASVPIPPNSEYFHERRKQLRDRAMERIKRSRWFTRGWTLQELLAPPSVLFFSKDWKDIGFKRTRKSRGRKSLRRAWRHDNPLELNGIIRQITKVSYDILFLRKPFHLVSAAERFSWARSRTTSRKEDLAYCLLGIFGVNMPLLYGEGDRAFVRLQEEIMKQSDDLTLLGWNLDASVLSESGTLFATCPSQFSQFSDIRLTHSCNLRENQCFKHSIGNGLRIRVFVGAVNSTSLVPKSSCPYPLLDGALYAVFPPTYDPREFKSQHETTYHIAIPLTSMEMRRLPVHASQIVEGTQLWRLVGGAPIRIRNHTVSKMDTREIVIRRDIPPFAAVIHSKEKRRVLQRCKGSLQFKPSITADAWDSHFTISLASFPRLQNQRLHVLEVFPPDRWWPKSRTIVFGTLVMQSRLSWIAGASEAEIRERNSFEDSIFIRFGIGYNNPELCCLVEILREVSWEGSLVFKTRLSIYSNVGSMRPYLSLADAFLSGESRELVRGNCADRPLSELPYRLRRRNGRDAMAVLDFGSVEETKNDFAEYSVQRNISHLAGISV